jgi:5'-AMP-activated protein kinase catalytic alpha subunit
MEVELTSEYKNVRFIIEGTYSAVYSGERRKDNKQVIIKVSPLDCKERKRAFQNDVKLLKYLKHETICELQKAYKQSSSRDKKERYGIEILERLDIDLLQYITQRGKLQEEEAKLVFKQICEAIHRCHTKNVAHLDLKPDNILLQLLPTGEIHKVKICDFGLAKRWKKRDDPNVTIEPEEKIGSIEYLAPELRNALFPTTISLVKADVYSLGILLYGILTAQFPTLTGRGVPKRQRSCHVLRSVSPSSHLIDLFLEMVKEDVVMRPTLSDVLLNPWFDL